MSMRIVVVLPAPFPPTKPVSLPAGTVKLTSSTARISPKVRESRRTSMSAVARGLVSRSPLSLMAPP